MKRLLTMSLVLVAVFAVSAPASVISVNLSTMHENYLEPANIGYNPTTGAVPASNWNDLAVGPNIWQSLHDNSYVWSGAEFNVSYEYDPASYYPIYPNWPGYTTAMPVEADNKLLSGHIWHSAGTDTVTQFRNIPYAAYDVYVYYNSGGVTNNYQTFTIVENGFSAIGSELTTTPDSAFVLSNGTNDANYVKFSNVTLSAFTLRASSTNNMPNYFNGFQIVQVPEPMTIGLLTLGGLLLRRRS